MNECGATTTVQFNTVEAGALQATHLQGCWPTRRIDIEAAGLRLIGHVGQAA